MKSYIPAHYCPFTVTELPYLRPSSLDTHKRTYIPEVHAESWKSEAHCGGVPHPAGCTQPSSSAMPRLGDRALDLPVYTQVMYSAPALFTVQSTNSLGRHRPRGLP